jgi:hypothetical protein
MLFRMTMLAAVAILAGCGSQPGATFGEKSLVSNTPVYRANRVLYMDPETAPAGSIVAGAKLLHPHEARDAKTAVRHGEPVTIIVNRAYVPLSVIDKEKNARLASLIGTSKTRDIAVLLDVGLTAGQDESFIAVWYQRDVPVDEVLSFQDLTVFSKDMWDSIQAPYFRMRIVDVAFERNTRTGELLSQIGDAGGQLVSLIGTPFAGVLTNIASRAAQLVLTNEKNKNLVDITFQLYGTANLDQAGGSPLGLFRRGGMIVTGQPFEETTAFWNKNLRYDYRLQRIYEQPGITRLVDAPYIMATVMTSETSVPNVVQRRSREITRVLTNPSAVTEDLQDTITKVTALGTSLRALQDREVFRKNPTKSSFRTFLTAADTNWPGITNTEKAWLLSYMRRVAGVVRATPAEYITWYTSCAASSPFNPDSQKFDVSGSCAE